MIPEKVLHKIEQLSAAHTVPKSVAALISNFCQHYLNAVSTSDVESTKSMETLLRYIDLAVQQLRTPYAFQSIHQQLQVPLDYYAFGLDVIGPLVDKSHSTVLGWDNFEHITKQISAKENCILFSNHQTEPDPQIISVLLGDRYPELAKSMYTVAGDRVTTDPLAVPLSLGRNLVCIYSKRHIENPPERKIEKLEHNRRAMKQLALLLAEGGYCIVIFPSGGRDRPNTHGVTEVTPFDAHSIAMFYLIAEHCKTPVHFYPMALATAALAPPPQNIQKELGEERYVYRTPVGLALGEEIDHSSLKSQDKKEIREKRSIDIWQRVCNLYTLIKS